MIIRKKEKVKTEKVNPFYTLGNDKKAREDLIKKKQEAALKIKGSAKASRDNKK